MSYIDAPIRQYVEKIQALATKALQGEDVVSRIEQTVRDAIHHFGIVVGVDKNECAYELRRQLKQIAEFTHESQSAYQQAMRLAATLIPEAVPD